MQDNKHEHDRRQECTAEPEFDAIKNMSTFEINSLVAKSLRGTSNPKTQLGKEICWQ